MCYPRQVIDRTECHFLSIWMLPLVLWGIMLAAAPPVHAHVEPNSMIRKSHYIIKEARMRGLLPSDRETFTGPRWGAGQILTEGHTIEPGKYFVIRIQSDYDPEVYYEDEEQFDTLTLEIRNYHGSGTYRLASDEVRGFYSQGSQAWGLGEYSEGLQGTITIEASGPDETGPHVPEWRVTVDVTAQLANAHDATKHSLKQLNGSYHCPIVMVDQLGEKPTKTP